jgi:branched-chain amino acid transport system substrate-binding protein
VSLVQRLMQNDKVPVIIGTVSSGNVLAFAPIMQKAGVPLVAGPSIATNITAQFINETPSYIFRCSMVEKFQIENMLDWGVKTFKKIGLVHSTTGYAVFAAKEIQEGLKARNVQLVAVESAAPNVSDLTPQLLKMKEAGAELVLNFHESFELIYRPMSKLAYKPTVAGNWGLSSQKVLQIVGQQEIEGTVMGQALDMSLDALLAAVGN